MTRQLPYDLTPEEFRELARECETLAELSLEARLPREATRVHVREHCAQDTIDKLFQAHASILTSADVRQHGVTQESQQD